MSLYLPERSGVTGLRSSPVAAVCIALLALSALIIILGRADSLGFDWQAMLRDRAATDDPPPLAGLVSNVGIIMLGIPTLLWWSVIIYSRQWTPLAIATAVLPTLIVIDDFAMLHEGPAELFFYGGYAVAAVALTGLQLRVASKQSWLLLPAFALLGAAMAVDFLHVALGEPEMWELMVSVARTFAEDAFKFIGFALFAAHLLCCTAEVIERP